MQHKYPRAVFILVPKSVHDRKLAGMLFRPVYIRSKPLTYEPPVPPPPPPPPPREPTPPPKVPSLPPREEPKPVQVPEMVPRVEDKCLTPILICGKGVTAVYPREATDEVLSGRGDFFLLDERGLTLFEKKHIYKALRLDLDAGEKSRNLPPIRAHQRVVERRPNQYSYLSADRHKRVVDDEVSRFEVEDNERARRARQRLVDKKYSQYSYLLEETSTVQTSTKDTNDHVDDDDAFDFLWSSPRTGAMTSGSLHRGYTGPRA